VWENSRQRRHASENHKGDEVLCMTNLDALRLRIQHSLNYVCSYDVLSPFYNENVLFIFIFTKLNKLKHNYN
jgi:hypothetical protein